MAFEASDRQNDTGITQYMWMGHAWSMMCISSALLYSCCTFASEELWAFNSSAEAEPGWKPQVAPSAGPKAVWRHRQLSGTHGIRQRAALMLLTEIPEKCRWLPETCSNGVGIMMRMVMISLESSHNVPVRRDSKNKLLRKENKNVW